MTCCPCCPSTAAACCCAASPASASPRSCRPPPRRPRRAGCGCCGRPASSRRRGSRSPACTSCSSGSCDRLETLAPPQRHAVLAAFGMTERETPDLFLIALATLNVLSEVATPAPVVIVVEDAHWLDRSTLDVLAFVARRLESEPILILGAIRDGFDGGGFPELRLEGLDAAASAELLDSVAPGLEPDVRTRLLAEAAGNPLALVELPLATAQLRARHAAARVAAADRPARARVRRPGRRAAGADAPAAAGRRAQRPGVLERDPDGGRKRSRHAGARDRGAAGDGRGRRAALPPPARALGDPPGRERPRRATPPTPRWRRSSTSTAACGIARPRSSGRTRRPRASSSGPRRRPSGAARSPVAVSALTRAAELSDHPARRGARLLRAAELAFELGRSRRRRAACCATPSRSRSAPASAPAWRGCASCSRPSCGRARRGRRR